jgi:hypothetical protein
MTHPERRRCKVLMPPSKINHQDSRLKKIGKHWWIRMLLGFLGYYRERYGYIASFPRSKRHEKFTKTSLSIERLRRFAVLEIVRSISPRDLLVPCSRLILVRALAWARALPRFIDRFCSVLFRVGRNSHRGNPRWIPWCRLSLLLL